MITLILFLSQGFSLRFEDDGFPHVYLRRGNNVPSTLALQNSNQHNLVACWIRIYQEVYENLGAVIFCVRLTFEC